MDNDVTAERVCVTYRLFERKSLPTKRPELAWNLRVMVSYRVKQANLHGSSLDVEIWHPGRASERALCKGQQIDEKGQQPEYLANFTKSKSDSAPMSHSMVDWSFVRVFAIYEPVVLW